MGGRVTSEDCQRFAALWEKSGSEAKSTSTVERDEFVAFCRFVAVMTDYEEALSEDRSSQRAGDQGGDNQQQTWGDDVKVDDLIDRLTADRSLVEKLKDDLPPALQEAALFPIPCIQSSVSELHGADKPVSYWLCRDPIFVRRSRSVAARFRSYQACGRWP